MKKGYELPGFTLALFADRLEAGPSQNAEGKVT